MAASPAYPSRRHAWALGLLGLGGVALGGAGLAGCGAHRPPAVQTCPGDTVAPAPAPEPAIRGDMADPVLPPEGSEVDGDMVPVEPVEHLDGEMPAPDEVDIPPSEEPVGEEPPDREEGSEED